MTSECSVHRSMQVIHIDLNFSQSYQCQCTRTKRYALHKCALIFLWKSWPFLSWSKSTLNWLYFYSFCSGHKKNMYRSMMCSFFSLLCALCIFPTLSIKSRWKLVRDFKLQYFDGWLIDLEYFVFSVTIHTFYKCM